MAPPPRTAVVLSGGGVRGAYQVGVIDGIVDVLGLRGAAGPPLFDTFAGTSIGALNSAFLAAGADRADHHIDELAGVWRGLALGGTVKLAPLRWRGRGCLAEAPATLGWSLFDPRPIEALVERVVDWDRLHRHVAAGRVRALVVAALDVATGRTVLFEEQAPGVALRPAAFPVHHTVAAPITADKVLASAALPLVFPARRIDDRYYVDGALRFSTPIQPALRAEPERVVVISLLHGREHRGEVDVLEYPSVAFLLGKVLNALLLDPVAYDLESLLQQNQIFRLLGEALTPDELARAQARLEAARILPWREVPTLAFRPSEDIGLLTAAFIRDELDDSGVSWLARRLIRLFSHSDLGQEADLASILLFDGRLAARLIDLGRRDAHAAARRIRDFFASAAS